jgi:hypothetical protein
LQVNEARKKFLEDDVQKAWATEIERRSLIASDERGTDWRAALEEIRTELLRR